ncbi:hypothetical protein L798_14614 [Zootermopsis nevadensis]|uniref:Gustatory receptor n=1 Tax=Zootermopsis nevadensis TaxID=136037 RepID=A0A067QZ23_ZOONE|nr:hypothetical protein L798_14614 [Zootermopsis nevadensis]
MKTFDNIFTAIKPLFYLSKAFGLAPLSWIKEKDSGTVKPSSRSFDVYWGAVLFLCFLVNVPLEFYVMQFNNWNYPIKLNVVCCIYKISCHLSGMTSLLFISAFKRHSLPQILILISEVDQLLYKKPERLILYKETRSFISRELCILSIIFIPLLVTYFYFSPKEGLLRYFVLMIESIQNLSFMLMIVQFTNIILLLRQRYKCLNRWLDIHSNIWRDRIKSVGKDVPLLSDVETYVLSRYSLKYGRLKILEQRHIYSKLYDIVCLVNSYFGLPVFMLTFWMFVSVVFISYSCMLSIMLVISTGKELGEHVWAMTGLIWSFACVVLLLLIIAACHTTTEECGKSQILVEKLILRSGLSYETINELKFLSAQLKNMKVSFTAYGFFSLDLPFMYNFVGVICTYLLILAQFN